MARRSAPLTRPLSLSPPAPSEKFWNFWYFFCFFLFFIIFILLLKKYKIERGFYQGGETDVRVDSVCPCLQICTNCYSLEYTIRLMNVLIIRHNLNCSLHLGVKDKYRIYIKQDSTNGRLLYYVLLLLLISILPCSTNWGPIKNKINTLPHFPPATQWRGGGGNA
nr:hypothetical protein [Morchella crassipes]